MTQSLPQTLKVLKTSKLSELSDLPQVADKYFFDKKLAHLTWFKVGGKADVLFKPNSLNDLKYFLSRCNNALPISILGAGSNILIRDKGVRGVVVKLSQGFNDLRLQNDMIYAGAGILDYNLSMFAMQNSIAGFEFLSGIPGTVGGAIAMNAGAYGQEICNILEKIEAIDYCGNIHYISQNDFKFSYRTNSLAQKLGKDLIFIGGWFRTHQSSIDDIRKKMNDIKHHRETTQPIHTRTSGSTFKNPDGYQAWRLIDAVNCRGYRIGGAQISVMHCNFIINDSSATASDIENLIQYVQEKVYNKFNIQLEPEIKIIGEK